MKIKERSTTTRADAEPIALKIRTGEQPSRDPAAVVVRPEANIWLTNNALDSTDRPEAQVVPVFVALAATVKEA